MKEFKISELIYKSLSGELSKMEKDDLQDWLNQKDNQGFYDNLKSSKSINNKFDVYNSFNSRKAFAQINPRIKHPQKPKAQLYWQYVKYAAIFVIALGLGWAAYQTTNPPEKGVLQVAMVKKSNPKGQKTTFKLPDGTIVNLNSSSSLEYVDDIDHNRRIVQLEGEAFFDVAENKVKPFTVVSGDISTTALGTSFNVKAYPDESELKVVLIAGKVEIRSNKVGQSQKLYLTPGFGVAYSGKTNDLVKYNFDQAFELGWKNSTLCFDESDLDEVITQLERWYGVTIRIENKDKVKRWKYSSRFKNESLENVLKGISYIQEFKYEIKEKEVTLKF